MVNIGSVIPAATRSGQSRFGVLRLRGSQYGRMTIRPYPPEGGTPNKDSGGVTRTHVYTYDDSGNMVHDENHAYGYDPENRLVLVRKSGPYGTLDYETITKYVYDGDHCIAEYNAYDQLKRKYIYGPGVDEPVCMIDTMTSPPVTSYYHFDALGSVVALTNASGNTVEVYEYDVYGRVGATDESHPNRFMFTGREFDKETGLYYYRARCYNSSIGRFLQTDTIGYKDGLNLYAYCHNNPGNRTDPYGTRSWLYGAGHITIESSCAGAKMAILPEDNGSWIADPNAGQDYEADAVGWYTPDGNQVGIKVPDNCELVISCEPVIGEPDKLWVNWHWTCTGLLASPSDVTPGDGPWPPALPPEEKVHVRIAKQEDKTT
jgi:RHS repeat-associated protein